MRVFYFVFSPTDETLVVVLTVEDDVESGGGHGSLLTEDLSGLALELTVLPPGEGGGRICERILL